MSKQLPSSVQAVIGGESSKVPGGLLCKFSVPGQPVPKARPRVVAGRVYTPKRTTDAEVRIAQYFWATHPQVRTTDRPISLVLVFRLKGAQTCDWDNLSKLVCDALNGKAWMDDRQIVYATVRVWPNQAEPSTYIEAYTL